MNKSTANVAGMLNSASANLLSSQPRPAGGANYAGFNANTGKGKVNDNGNYGEASMAGNANLAKGQKIGLGGGNIYGPNVRKPPKPKPKSGSNTELGKLKVVFSINNPDEPRVLSYVGGDSEPRLLAEDGLLSPFVFCNKGQGLDNYMSFVMQVDESDAQAVYLRELGTDKKVLLLGGTASNRGGSSTISADEPIHVGWGNFYQTFFNDVSVADLAGASDDGTTTVTWSFSQIPAASTYTVTTATANGEVVACDASIGFFAVLSAFSRRTSSGSGNGAFVFWESVAGNYTYRNDFAWSTLFAGRVSTETSCENFGYYDVYEATSTGSDNVQKQTSVSYLEKITATIGDSDYTTFFNDGERSNVYIQGYTGEVFCGESSMLQIYLNYESPPTYLLFSSNGTFQDVTDNFVMLKPVLGGNACLIGGVIYIPDTASITTELRKTGGQVKVLAFDLIEGEKSELFIDMTALDPEFPVSISHVSYHP